MTSLEFSSRRSPVYATRGIVAASQPLAVAAGLEILRQGGNAVDAAVACAASLGVTEPASTGLGGDCFALFYSADTGRMLALNGSGRAPRSLTLQRVHADGFGDEIPPYHPYNITVPGACAAWCDLIERFGSLNMSVVLAPAIRLAEEGFPVGPIAAHAWAEGVAENLSTAMGGMELTINGRAPRPGEIFRNLGLARALKAVAYGGKTAFYQGEIAEAVAKTVQAAGGCLELDDLAAHTSTWEDPISVVYRGVRVWECPPNGQGLTALLALNILEGFELAELAALSAERLHLEIEALRLAFADARRYVADPAVSAPPVAGLLDKDYAANRRKLIRMDRAQLDHLSGLPVPGSDTVYLSVVDRWGNACSLINSIYMQFGTGIVPAGWGFCLQNRGSNFSLNPDHPNALAPGKRPYHTIIPAMATLPSPVDPNREELYACFGVMGGFMQPQGHVQVIVGLVDDGLDPQTALDRPRFCLVEGNPGGEVALEQGIPVEVMAALAEMGHRVIPVAGYGRSIFGRGQIIRRHHAGAVYSAGSDPRSDGCAMTW